MHAKALREQEPAQPDVPTAPATLHVVKTGDSTITQEQIEGAAPGAAQEKESQAVTWIVVANGSRARVFETHGRNGAVRPAGPRDLYRDADGGARKSLGDPTREFANKVARFLDEALEEGQFDHLVLVATPQSIGDLKGALSTPVKTRVKCDIHRNLMNVACFELTDYIGYALKR